MATRTLCFIPMFLIVCVLSVFSSGRLEPSQETLIKGIVVSAPVRVNRIEIIAKELPLKPGFIQKQAIIQDGIEIWPLINLDLYGKPPRRVGIGRVKVFRPEITVSIPFSVVKKLTDQDAKDLDLYFYVDGEWVPAKSSSDIGNYRKKSDMFSFKVIDWPTDDRMMGCGH